MKHTSAVREIHEPGPLEPEAFGPDGWAFRQWPDGTDQWMHISNYRDPEEKNQDYIVERVVRPNSRRKRWVVVNRKSPDENIELHEYDLYPPKVAGPFPNVESAKLACLLLISSSK